MTTNDRTSPDEAVARLEAAAAALGVAVDPEAVEPLSLAARAGSAAGAIASTIITLIVDAAVDDHGATDLDTHRSMIYTMDTVADDLREDQLYAYLNLLQAWALTEAMQRGIGPEDARAVVTHLEHAKDHLEHANHDPDGCGPARMHFTGDKRGAAPSDLMDEFTPPSRDPVERLSRAAMALGLLPGVKSDDDSPIPPHPGFAAATIAGTLAARSTIEMIHTGADIPAEHRLFLPQLWCSGFEMGLITTHEPEVSHTVIGGTMMRLVSMIAAWHANAAPTPRAQAIAGLCMATVEAGRADGLATFSIDRQAEYIALHGTDTADAHRQAVDLAEAAVIELKHLDML